MVTLIRIGIFRDRESNTPTSIYKIKNRTHVFIGRSWERLGISKAKEEESYPCSQFCPGKCKQRCICTHVHILILNICSLAFSCISTATSAPINSTNKYRYIFFKYE